MTGPYRAIRLRLTDVSTGLAIECGVSLHDAERTLQSLGEVLPVGRARAPRLHALPAPVITAFRRELHERRRPRVVDPGHSGAISVLLTLSDEITGHRYSCRLSHKEAIDMYFSLREILGDYAVNPAELAGSPAYCVGRATIRPAPKPH